MGLANRVDQLVEMNILPLAARRQTRVLALAEPAVVQVFKTQYQAMINLVKSLPENQPGYANIHTRPDYEIMAYWTEHKRSWAGLTDPGLLDPGL